MLYLSKYFLRETFILNFKPAATVARKVLCMYKLCYLLYEYYCIHILDLKKFPRY